MTRLIFPTLFGLMGAAILIGLGVWQMQRLAWKEDVLADISARLNGTPVALADLGAPNKDQNNYQRVTLDATFTGQELHAYAPQGYNDLAYRVLAEVADRDRLLLVDLGLVRAAQKDAVRLQGRYRITGNLSWPDDFDAAFTADPDRTKNIWFARDLNYIATHFGEMPLLVVASAVEPADGSDYSDSQLLPVTTNIPNDHREYAITWFSLAFVWLGMTGFWLWRIRRRPD